MLNSKNVQLTFIFKIDKTPAIYHGKIILNNLSSDVSLDFTSKNIIQSVLNTYLLSINMPRLRYMTIGIIGMIREKYESISEEETCGIFNLYIT